jgi:uncharacterized protein (DUF885 family)
MIALAATVSLATLPACSATDNSANAERSVPAASSADDSTLQSLAREVIDDRLSRNPSLATDLGVHRYDAQVEDLSADATAAATQAMKRFRDRLAALDTMKLSQPSRADRELLMHSLDADILSNEVIKPWATNPDNYSSSVTNAAYVIMKRNFAPQADRLRSLVAREQLLPAMLVEARKNLANPPKVYTEIALEQIDGNISFFKNDVPAAFTAVKDPALLQQFRTTNAAVMAALGEYKQWMQKELLPKSTGNFAYGAQTYSKALAANEMIDIPLDRLLAIAEADRRKNETAFQAVAKQIDPNKSADAVLASLQADHPAPNKLLAATQATLDSLRQFIVAHHIITMPPAPPARVMETPPFERSTTSASMDTPGPFETTKLDARYNMTLPDPRWPRAKQEEFMNQWYYAAISNVSVHEVYPGHYTQSLYAPQFPSDTRKVFGANTNIEGWAHYAEQMMLDEGFHAGDPKYRLAQLQDALLRDVRFIVGIKLHTQHMTVDQATQLFATQGHQPRPVAISEAKRGTADALYGYYTMGKLMILKLRDDYKAKMGAQYSLEQFHDDFIKRGPLPLPLMRKAMLGNVGQLF